MSTNFRFTLTGPPPLRPGADMTGGMRAAEPSSYDRQRKIAVKCMELEEMLENKGHSQTEIETKVSSFRALLVRQNSNLINNNVSQDKEVFSNNSSGLNIRRSRSGGSREEDNYDKEAAEARGRKRRRHSTSSSYRSSDRGRDDNDDDYDSSPRRQKRRRRDRRSSKKKRNKREKSKRSHRQRERRRQHKRRRRRVSSPTYSDYEPENPLLQRLRQDSDKNISEETAKRLSKSTEDPKQKKRKKKSRSYTISTSRSRSYSRSASSRSRSRSRSSQDKKSKKRKPRSKDKQKKKKKKRAQKVEKPKKGSEAPMQPTLETVQPRPASPPPVVSTMSSLTGGDDKKIYPKHLPKRILESLAKESENDEVHANIGGQATDKSSTCSGWGVNGEEKQTIASVAELTTCRWDDSPRSEDNDDNGVEENNGGGGLFDVEPSNGGRKNGGIYGNDADGKLIFDLNLQHRKMTGGYGNGGTDQSTFAKLANKMTVVNNSQRMAAKVSHEEAPSQTNGHDETKNGVLSVEDDLEQVTLPPLEEHIKDSQPPPVRVSSSTNEPCLDEPDAAVEVIDMELDDSHEEGQKSDRTDIVEPREEVNTEKKEPWTGSAGRRRPSPTTRSRSTRSRGRRRSRSRSADSYSYYSSRSRSRTRSYSSSSYSRSRSRSYSSYSSTSRSRSRSRSPSIPRRRGSPSFLDRRRITSARKRPIPYKRASPSPTPSDSRSWSSRSVSRSSRSHWSRSRSRSWSRCTPSPSKH